MFESEKEKLANILKYGQCKCRNPGLPTHTCPYSEDIDGDYEFHCNCCDECIHNCAMDI